MLLKCWWLTLLWLPFVGAAQLSDSLYAILPDTLQPKKKQSPTLAEQASILKASPDFYAKKFDAELQAMASSLEQKTLAAADQKTTIASMHALGVFYSFLCDYKKSVGYYSVAIKQMEAMPGYNSKLAWCYSDMAISYYAMGNNDDSTIGWLHKSLKVGGIEKDSALLSQNYNVYSVVYDRLESYKQAIYYCELAIKTAPASTVWNTNYTTCVLQEGISYFRYFGATKQQVYADSAEFFFRRVMDYKKEEAEHWYAQCYYQLGAGHYVAGNYARAKQLLDSAILPQYNHSAYSFPNNFYRIYVTRALAQIRLGQYAQGKKTLDSLNVRGATTRLEILKAFHQYAEDNHRWENALFYYKQYKKLGDSLNLSKERAKMFEVEQKYSVAQKEVAITKLENENLKQKQQRNMALAASVIILLILIIFYFQYKRIRAKRKLAEQTIEREMGRHEEELQLLEADMKVRQVDAVMAQRKKIAGDMHDDLSGSFVTLRYYIADMKASAQHNEAKEVLDIMENELATIHKNARQYMQQLSNNVQEMQYDPTAVLDDLCKEITSKTNLQVRLDVDRQQLQWMLEPAQYGQLYLIVKEAITNTLKHASASQLQINIYFENNICNFIISDNGAGFNTGQITKGLGLQSSQQRVQQLNGVLQIASNNTGTVIKGSFPI